MPVMTGLTTLEIRASGSGMAYLTGDEQEQRPARAPLRQRAHPSAEARLDPRSLFVGTAWKPYVPTCRLNIHHEPCASLIQINAEPKRYAHALAVQRIK
jgi:hypothetical protein